MICKISPDPSFPKRGIMECPKKHTIVNQKGVSIIAVIAAMLILSVMGVTLISLVTTGSDVSINQLHSEQAFNVAEGGKEYILANRSFPNYSLPSPGVNLGAGNFTVATPTYVTPNPIAVGDTTINVDSTANFPAPGRIIIDSELIDYTGTTPTSFTGATRGAGGGGIAFDAASSSSGDNVTNLTWAHTVTALGSNRILIVGVSIRGIDAVSTVTYAGTPLTLVGAQNETTNDNARVEIWRLVAPATGANNIVVDFGAGNNTRFVGGAVSLTGVDQTTPIDAAFAGAFGNILTPSVTVTTVTNNAWVIDTLAARNAPTAIVGAGQTQRWNTSIATRITGAGSTEGPKTPAGAVTMSWTLSAARDWAIGSVAIRPAGGTPSATHAIIGNAVYPVTTLTADPGAAGTTINVASTAGFAIPGAIKIDNEYIYCSSTTATTFTGCTRGYNASTAAAHAVSSNVFQYIVTSTGTVGNSNRVVNVGVNAISGSIASIAFDAASSSSGDNVTNLTWAHTVTALGSNRILIVGVSIRGIDAVSTVTYAGTPLTLVGAQNETTNDNARVEIWRLVAPATGANNIVVDFGAGNNTRFVGGAVSLTGVDQTTPIDAAFAGAFGNILTPSVTVTTVTNNAWVIDTLAARNAPTAIVGAGQTQRWNTSIATRITGAGSTEGPKTPAGAVTMSWTLSAARDWAIGTVAIRPAVAVTTLTHEEVY